jgi:hypothetical protein
MFRLSESDYRKLEPLALKVYRGSARSAHVAQLMESKVGRRALVDMMFLEEDSQITNKRFNVRDILSDVFKFSKFGKSGTTYASDKDSAVKQISLEEYQKLLKSLETYRQQVDELHQQNIYQQGLINQRDDEIKEMNKRFEKERDTLNKIISKRSNKLLKTFQHSKELEQQAADLVVLIKSYESKNANLETKVKNLNDLLNIKSKTIEEIRDNIIKNLKYFEKDQTALADQIALIQKNVDPKVFEDIVIKKAKENPIYAKTVLQLVNEKQLEINAEAEKALQETLRFKNKIRSYFVRLNRLIKGKLNSLLKSIYSFFVERKADGVSIKWAHVAIVATILIAIGFLLFKTSIGQKIRTFVMNALKAGINGIKNAVRFVFGKSNAPKEAIKETEDFLDEAAA